MKLSIQIQNAASHLRVRCSWGPVFMVTPMFPSVRPPMPHGKFSLLTSCCNASHVRNEKDSDYTHCALCGRGQGNDRTVFPMGSSQYREWVESQFEPLLAELVAANLVAALEPAYRAVLAGPNAEVQPYALIYSSPSPGV